MATPRPRVWSNMTANVIRECYLDWRAPLKGRSITAAAWASDPAGFTFTNLRLLGTRTLVDVTPPAIGQDTDFQIRCKVTDSSGHIHETEPAIEVKVVPGGNY